MRPRNIVLIGIATVLGGILLQRIILAAASAFAWSNSQSDLYQNVVDGLLWLVATVGEVAVPLGAALIGTGIAVTLLRTGTHETNVADLSAKPLRKEA